LPVTGCRFPTATGGPETGNPIQNFVDPHSKKYGREADPARRTQLLAATDGNVTPSRRNMGYPHKLGPEVFGNRGVTIIGSSAEIGGFHADFSLTRRARFIEYRSTSPIGFINSSSGSVRS
jgi:hypothetical protein